MNETERQLAAALGRIPSGLFIVTAKQQDAETGMLASWVQQCSFKPPMLSIVLKGDRPLASWLQAGAPFGVNILDDTQTDMIAHFGRGFAPGEPAFQGIELLRSANDLPVLADALAFLECRPVHRCPAGDHELFVGEVLGGRLLGEGQPMVHLRKSGFHY